MLTISFGSRTDSTRDPLVERALSLATEFMDLSGRTPPLSLRQIKFLTKGYHRSIIKYC